MLCRTAHTYSPYQTPLFTSGTHCCAGLLQGSGKHLVAGLMVPGLGKITAHTEPSGAVVARLQTRQRAHACIPYTQKYTFQLGGSWSHKKAPLFAPDSHEESWWTSMDSEWGDRHSSASSAASSPNMASSRQVSWKYPPLSRLSQVWSTASLLSAFGNLFTLAKFGLLQPIIARLFHIL